ncbi:hypothetical protein J6590_011259 [Homalodisca vitripennis]|nr:hypothetical protein J6590_011259 [Homalodisca vitripennis]
MWKGFRPLPHTRLTDTPTGGACFPVMKPLHSARSLPLLSDNPSDFSFNFQRNPWLSVHPPVDHHYPDPLDSGAGVLLVETIHPSLPRRPLDRDSAFVVSGNRESPRVFLTVVTKQFSFICTWCMVFLIASILLYPGERMTGSHTMCGDEYGETTQMCRYLGSFIVPPGTTCTRSKHQFQASPLRWATVHNAVEAAVTGAEILEINGRSWKYLLYSSPLRWATVHNAVEAAVTGAEILEINGLVHNAVEAAVTGAEIHESNGRSWKYLLYSSPLRWATVHKAVEAAVTGAEILESNGRSWKYLLYSSPLRWATVVHNAVEAAVTGAEILESNGRSWKYLLYSSPLRWATVVHNAVEAAVTGAEIHESNGRSWKYLLKYEA